MNRELLEIRKSKIEDLEDFTRIYNQAIKSAQCTCDRTVLTIEQRVPWFNEHQCERFPLYACVYDGRVVGYISLSPYKTREALADVAEVSYYLDFDYRRMGLGSELLGFIIEEAKKLGFSTVIAIIVGTNIASESLAKKFGFEEWGRMPKICNFDGDLRDHVYLGLSIKSDALLSQ